jgi:23S rRNA (cytidine2498-2'-O)-methyltransferase
MPNQVCLALCQSGFEHLLTREMGSLGAAASASGPGWAAAPGAASLALRGAAFAHAVLDAGGVAEGERVNEIAQRIADFFAASLVGERVEGAWPCVFAGGQDVPGLGRRVAAVEAEFRAILRRRLGRVAKLAVPETPRVGAARGLFAWFTDFGRAHLARSAFLCGPRRMADDENAPSRSYLKVEEAYAIVGAEPRAGEVVCDLGAAPGGWSYSAARRGARVVAVDNGPLKGGAAGNALIEHRAEDAFGFGPPRGGPYDWLFCDMLEDPRRVIDGVLSRWLRGGWCRRFVVNLKFGRVDPIALLGELRSAASPLAPLAGRVRIVHLYHDREEFTVTGTLPQ